MTAWKTLSQLYTDKFCATGDIKYALKSLAADARVPSRPKFKLNQVTVEDFLLSLDYVSRSGGDVDDGVQKILNKQVTQFLLQYLKDVRKDIPVLRSSLPKNHLTGLISEVLPFDKDGLGALRDHLLGSTYPTPEIGGAIKEVASSNESLRNAMSFAIGMAFISVIKQQIINNPILTILPDNMLKVAAKKSEFQYRSPRLNDLVDALRIVHGKLLIEYNQAALADFMQGSTEFEEVFPTGVSSVKDVKMSETSKQLAVMSSSYIRYYKELQRALGEYCWANDGYVGSMVISKQTIQGEVLTPNVYLDPGIKNLSEVKGLSGPAGLISRTHKLASLDLSMTMWNGEKYNPSTVSLSIDDIRRLFLKNREYTDVAAEIIDDSMESMKAYRDHIQSQSRSEMIVALSSIMINKDARTAENIYTDFIVDAENAINRSVATVDGYYSDAVKDAKKTYGAADAVVEISGTDFKVKDITNIRSFNVKLLNDLSTLSTRVFNEYGRLFRDRSALNMILTNIFKTHVMPLLPLTMRYIYNSPAARSLVQSAQNELAKPESINDKIQDASHGIFQPLHKILTSMQFSERYKENEKDYNSTQVAVSSISRLRDESIGGEAAVSKLTLPILQHLGIDDVGLKSIMAELALLYGGSSDMKRKREVINKIISDVMTKFDELNRQGLTEGISREHVIVYVCNKVLPGVIEEYVSEAMNKRFDAKTNEQMEQISNFVRTNFMSLKGGKGGKLLASNTVYGKLSELYSAIAKERIAGTSEENLAKMTPLGAIVIGADYGYRSARAAPALAVIRELFEKNKSDPSVSKDNWADPINPRPRDWGELAQLTGAFADPIPDTSSESKGIVSKERLNIQPGQRYSKEQIEVMNSKRREKEGGNIVLGTVHRTLTNTIRRLGNTLSGNPVAAIRIALTKRKKEILSVSKAYESDIIPYTIGGAVSLKDSPFVSDTYIPPQVEVNFSEVKLDTDSSKKIIDESDEYPKIKDIINDLAKGGVRDETLKKVEIELRKLPISYLSDKNLQTTIKIVLDKVAPGAKSSVRRDISRSVPKNEAPQHESGSDFIRSLSKTIFLGDKLTDRLAPNTQDTIPILNRKAEELMKYLRNLISAQTELRTKLLHAEQDPKLSANLRNLQSLSKVYGSQLYKAINHAKKLSARLSSRESESEFSNIRESLPESKRRIEEFINRMSESPLYKSKDDVMRRVRQALGSLIDVRDMSEAVSPKTLQLLLMDLNRRAASGDEFNNLILELDRYRVRETMPPADIEDIQDEARFVGEQFQEQGERWKSVIEQEQLQSFTGSNKRGDQ